MAQSMEEAVLCKHTYRYTTMKAKKLSRDSGYFSKVSDKSVVLKELSLSLYTSLSLLSMESSSSSSRSQEGSVSQKITLELLNKAFTAKAT